MESDCCKGIFREIGASSLPIKGWGCVKPSEEAIEEFVGVSVPTVDERFPNPRLAVAGEALWPCGLRAKTGEESDSEFSLKNTIWRIAINKTENPVS